MQPRAIKTLDSALSRIESALILSMFATAFVLGVMQVGLRYVFNTGFHWNEAVFVLLTVASVLIGGSRAVREGFHARVEIIASILPEKGVHWCNFLSMAAALMLSGFYIICGYLYCLFVGSMDLRDVESGIPLALIYGIVPLSMTLFSLRYIIKLWEWRDDPGAYSRFAEIELPGPATKDGDA